MCGPVGVIGALAGSLFGGGGHKKSGSKNLGQKVTDAMNSVQTTQDQVKSDQTAGIMLAAQRRKRRAGSLITSGHSIIGSYSGTGSTGGGAANGAGGSVGGAGGGYWSGARSIIGSYIP